MKRITAALVVVLLAGTVVLAEEEQKAEDWQDTIHKKLQTTIDQLDKQMSLRQALANISALSGVTIVLDKQVPGAVAGATVTLKAEKDTLQAVLGNVLKSAGLRYTLKDGGIFVSTVENLVKLLLSGDQQDGDEEAQPLSPADALRLSGETKFEDIPDLSNPYEALGFEPWRKPEEPYVDPKTGITQFPAPPIWVEAEDADSPRFKFTDTPSFLKADYLWEEVYSNDKAQLEEAELLGRLTRLLKSNPKFAQKEVLDQFIKFLEAEEKKAEK